MKKITEDTEFDYYYSGIADQMFGHRLINGIKYTERVLSEKSPVNEYADMVVVVEKFKPFKVTI